MKNAISYYINQDYADKQLIIFNHHPISLKIDSKLSEKENIAIINSPGKYNGLGGVRNAALNHAKGDIFVCWDDDDWFLPWHLSQGAKKLKESKHIAWKPSQSWFTPDNGVNLSIGNNNHEATVLIRMDIIKKIGFREGNANEHLWYEEITQNNILLVEDVRPFLSYVYVWGNGLHHWSGDLKNPSNHENHLASETDHGNNTPLEPDDVSHTYQLVSKAVKSNFGSEGLKLVESRFQKCLTKSVVENTTSSVNFTSIPNPLATKISL